MNKNSHHTLPQILSTNMEYTHSFRSMFKHIHTNKISSILNLSNNHQNNFRIYIEIFEPRVCCAARWFTLLITFNITLLLKFLHAHGHNSSMTSMRCDYVCVVRLYCVTFEVFVCMPICCWGVNFFSLSFHFLYTYLIICTY